MTDNRISSQIGNTASAELSGLVPSGGNASSVSKNAVGNFSESTLVQNLGRAGNIAHLNARHDGTQRTVNAVAHGKSAFPQSKLIPQSTPQPHSDTISVGLDDAALNRVIASKT
jgi:hypothetical protein